MMSGIVSGIPDFPIVVLTFFVGLTVFAVVYISKLLKTSAAEDSTKRKEPEATKKEKPAANVTQKPSKKKHQEKWTRDSKQTFSHPWLLTSLKGHSGTVLDMDFSSNGKYLATCAEDRSIFLWSTKDWNQREHKFVRINVEFDHATFIKWSPDSKAFIIQKNMENIIEVYKIAKKPDGWISGASKAIEFPKQHEEAVIGLGIACNGKYIMSCSNKTDLLIWDLKGQQLAKVDTYLMNTHCARISPCGKFVVASGFAPDVKVWEVRFSKTGEFSQVSRAFELQGHSSGVYDFGFSADSSRMATVSKDGTWKLYDTNIEYMKGEDPHLLMTGSYKHENVPAHLALSPNGDVIAIASNNKLMFYSALSGKCDKIIENIYTGPITALLFDSLGKYVLTAGERHVRVFHNVTGYRTFIAATKEKFRQSVSSAQKERMTKQIEEAEAFLKSVGEKA